MEIMCVPGRNFLKEHLLSRVVCLEIVIGIITRLQSGLTSVYLSIAEQPQVERPAAALAGQW